MRPYECVCMCVCVWKGQALRFLRQGAFCPRRILCGFFVWDSLHVCGVLPGFLAVLPQRPFHLKNHLIVFVGMCSGFMCPCVSSATQTFYVSPTKKDGSLKAEAQADVWQLEDMQTDWIRQTKLCNSGQYISFSKGTQTNSSIMFEN